MNTGLFELNRMRIDNFNTFNDLKEKEIGNGDFLMRRQIIKSNL